MLAKLVVPGIFVAAIINLLPVVGVFGNSWLKSLYGFDVSGADLEILLRHRAVLFGIVGVFLLAGVVWPNVRTSAILVAAASMASFIVVALIVGEYSSAITKIVLADVIGLAALLPAFVVGHLSHQSSE